MGIGDPDCVDTDLYSVRTALRHVRLAGLAQLRMLLKLTHKRKTLSPGYYSSITTLRKMR
jgi:hypothetical protein